jgi:hypothetical protein
MGRSERTRRVLGRAFVVRTCSPRLCSINDISGAKRIAALGPLRSFDIVQSCRSLRQS